MKFIFLTCLSVFVGVAATPAAADQMRAVLMSNSEALVTHAFSQPSVSLARQHQLAQYEALLGYQRKHGIDQLRVLKLAPVVTFDPNVTGGVPNGSISIAGLDFAIDPDFVSQSDVILGMTLRGSFRQNIAPFLSLDTKVSGSFGYAPRVKVTKSAASAATCIRGQVNRSRYLHACAGGAFRSVKLGDHTGRHFETGATQAFNAGGAMHAVTTEIGIRQVFPSASPRWLQSYGRVSIASAFSNGMAASATLELSEAVHGIQANRFSTSVRLAREINRRPASISAFYAEADGGRFLGQRRNDRTVGLSASYQISQRVDLSVSLSQTKSNAALFDGSPDFGATMNFQF